MKCSEAQELLKSDYWDKEASPVINREIKAHLEFCEQCRKLEADLAADRLIFAKAPRRDPPERVWQNIRAAIASETEEADDLVSPGIIERLKFLLWPAKPVLAWSGVLTVLLVGAIVSGGIIQNIRLAGKIDDAQIMADYSFNGENSEYLASLETNIEKYFL